MASLLSWWHRSWQGQVAQPGSCKEARNAHYRRLKTIIRHEGTRGNNKILTNETACAVLFLSLHLPPDEIECVNVSRNITKTKWNVSPMLKGCENEQNRRTVSVQEELISKGGRVTVKKESRTRQTLIKRSQLQPVMIPAAAGGKRIATLKRMTFQLLSKEASSHRG
jgi:hypothetical protein